MAALSVLLAGCWDTGDDAVDAGATEETGDDATFDDFPLNDYIADNGYDDVTLGRKLEDLHRQFGGATFEPIGSTGSVSTYSPGHV